MNLRTSLALALALPLALGALPVRAADTYDIHAVLPLTGGGAFIGTAMKANFEALETVINKDGGVNGKPVHFVLHDDETNPQRAVERTTEVLADKPLVDPKAADQARIFLVNAPEANAASIYLSDVDGSRMILEYPFLTMDGKSQVPAAEELEEAIYCAVVGATAEEQEKSGRCLVD